MQQAKSTAGWPVVMSEGDCLGCFSRHGNPQLMWVASFPRQGVVSCVIMYECEQGSTGLCKCLCECTCTLIPLYADWTAEILKFLP